MIASLLLLVAAYLAVGALFALWFCWRGARSMDGHAAQGSWGFRALIFPGTAALWPLLIHRVWLGHGRPPTERTPHRIASGEASANP